jgi:undecaprenyl diphosphate synthase
LDAGYEAGAKTLAARVRDALELGVRELTVYSLSTENLSRPAEDIDPLTAVLARRLETEIPRLLHDGVRVRILGSPQGLPVELTRQMARAQELTATSYAMTLFLAIGYGARADIIQAARRYQGGGERELRRLLYAPDMHDPDLILRTGGERRLSNFLLWQGAYSELIFRDELWPDFSRGALEQSFAEYHRRRIRAPNQPRIYLHRERQSRI